MKFKGFYDEDFKHIGFLTEDDERTLSDNYVLFTEEEWMKANTELNGVFKYDATNPQDLTKVQAYTPIIDEPDDIKQAIVETQKRIKKSEAMEKLAQMQAETIALTAPPEVLDKVKILFDEWQAGVEYKVDKPLIYQGILYKVIQAHTSQADWLPDVSVSLFAKVLTDPSGTPKEWVQPESTNPYQPGDKVLHKGKTWECTITNNVWEPGVYGWKEVM